MATHTKAELSPQLRGFGAKRYFELSDAIARYRFTDVGDRVMLALSSREADLLNVTSPTNDRGAFQISMASHAADLMHMPAVEDGTWGPIIVGATAADDGMVPMLSAGAVFAMQKLKSDRDFGISQGVPKNLQLRFALASYNAGRVGALKGFKEGDVDLHTTGGDYSADVLERWKVIAPLIAEWGWH